MTGSIRRTPCVPNQRRTTSGSGGYIPRDLLAQVRTALEGTYAVDREIGRGGAACVYLARDNSGRQVALKVLHPELRVGIAAERFLRETALLARLRHPHLGEFLASGEQGWLVYYTMAYVEGPTLKQLLVGEGELSVDATRTLARQMLAALAHAHGFGIVHRDVKPDNIVFGSQGAVLLDFGVARALSLSEDPLTRSGVTVGSSAYISPEQIAAAEDIDHRTDLYALGCLLFECLAGRPPYYHANENVVLQMHAVHPVPNVRHFRPETPSDLTDLIRKAMAKDRAARWEDAGQMQKALG